MYKGVKNYWDHETKIHQKEIIIVDNYTFFHGSATSNVIKL